jgi:hypothetical protein
MSRKLWSAVLVLLAVGCAGVGLTSARAAESKLFLFSENPRTGELEAVGAPLIWPWYAAALACLVVAIAVQLRGHR